MIGKFSYLSSITWWHLFLCSNWRCIKNLFFSNTELECETIKQENTRLQNIIDNQKYSVADIERINHERNELQQTINKLTKDLEAEQQKLWNEELKYARGKEAVCHYHFQSGKSS